jgi:hypothetical protein
MEEAHMNHQDSIRYFLFPHSVIAEHEARHLALLLPNLHLLEFVNPLQLPAWGQDHFSRDAALPDQALNERVRRYLRDYLDFAEVHRDSDTLSLLGQELHDKGNDPSRFFLQGELRGRTPQGPDMRAWLRLEAAAFLELARELDERELELENHYRRMEELEKGFREILGVIDGEEMEEVIETVNPPLVSDHSRFTYLLARRSLSWYRVFADNLQQPDVIPVALSREVIVELTDPIQTEWEHSGRELPLVQRSVAEIPNLRDLTNADFVALWQQLRESGTLRSHWEALHTAVAQYHEQRLWDDAHQQVKIVRDQIFDFCLQRNIHPKGQVALVMNHLQDISHCELWKRLDKTGFEHLASGTSAPPAGVTLLHLEYSP